MANEIVWFDSDEVGAPTLNNAAGSLIAVLDALLVTGFNVQGLTSITVSGAVATATKAGHGYSTGRMVDIANAGTALINGRKLITVTGSGNFTFPAPGVADGTISGTITAKRSPLGWSRTHSAGATVGMYSRTDVTATAMSLRVDDTAAGVASSTTARALMVESFTDVNTYSNPSPTVAQLSGGQYWTKGVNSASAKPWVLVGDSKTFYAVLENSNYQASSYSGAGAGLFGFGDPASYRAGDAYGCFLAGDSTGSGTLSLGSSVTLGAGTGGAAFVVARGASGIGTATFAGYLGHGSRRLGGPSGSAYPSPVDNGLVLSSPVLLVENNGTFGHPIRGEMRGLADPLASITLGLLHKQVLTGLTGSSRSWLFVAFQHFGIAGHAAFDITGPWA